MLLFLTDRQYNYCLHQLANRSSPHQTTEVRVLIVLLRRVTGERC